MQWVTRARPKIDRIACPWLIARFIDAEAEFLFVAPNEDMRVAQDSGATPFDLDGVAVLAEDVTGGTHLACGPIKPNVAGKIAVIDFDGVNCGSITAVANVKAAGAIGVIATISVPG